MKTDLVARLAGSMPEKGRPLVVAAWVGTAAFTITAVAATLAEGLRLISAIVALALFGSGCVAFLLAYAAAVERSRTEEIGIGGLYFLAGSAPRTAQAHLLGATAVQTVVAFTTAAIRPFTPLAFGILVPMYGLGVAGLWAARHGEFPRRAKLQPKKPSHTSRHRKGGRHHE